MARSHLPVSLMNRLNQTESVVFKFWIHVVFAKDLLFRSFRKTGSDMFISCMIYLLPNVPLFKNPFKSGGRLLSASILRQASLAIQSPVSRIASVDVCLEGGVLRLP